MSPQEERFEFDCVQKVTGSHSSDETEAAARNGSVGRSVGEAVIGRGGLLTGSCSGAVRRICSPGAGGRGEQQAAVAPRRRRRCRGSARAGGPVDGGDGGGMGRRGRGARVLHGRGLAHGTAEEEAERAGGRVRRATGGGGGL